MQLLHQAITTPILFDFYNYDADNKEFAQHFFKFTQVLFNKNIYVATHIGLLDVWYFDS